MCYEVDRKSVGENLLCAGIVHLPVNGRPGHRRWKELSSGLSYTERARTMYHTCVCYLVVMHAAEYGFRFLQGVIYRQTGESQLR